MLKTFVILKGQSISSALKHSLELHVTQFSHATPHCQLWACSKCQRTELACFAELFSLR